MQLTVTHQDLRNASTTIAKLAGDYETEYTSLYSKIAALKSDWQGVDNDAFAEKVESYRKYFEAMRKLMGEYATFLNQSAEIYKETQDKVKQAAGSL